MIAVPRMYVPRIIADGAGRQISFQLDGGGMTYTANVAAATYYTPESLLSAVATAMTGQTGRQVTATLDSSGNARIGVATGTIRITGGGVLDALGMEAVPFWAPSIPGRKQMPGLWLPGEAVRSDSGDVTVVEEGFQRSLTGVQRSVEHGSWIERRVVFEHLEEAVVRAPSHAPSNPPIGFDPDTIAYWQDGTNDVGGIYDLEVMPDGSRRRIGDATLAGLLRGEVTLEATVTLDGTWSADGAIFEYGDWGESEVSNILLLVGVDSDRRPYVGWESGSGIDQQLKSNVVLPLNEAVEIVVVRSRTSTAIRVGGWTVAIATSGLAAPTGGNSPGAYVWIGNRASTSGLFDGTITNVRLSSIARPAPEVLNDRSFPWSAAKQRFRWWPDLKDLDEWGDYYLVSPRRTWDPVRMFPRPALYRIELDFARYVG